MSDRLLFKTIHPTPTPSPPYSRIPVPRFEAGARETPNYIVHLPLSIVGLENRY